MGALVLDDSVRVRSRGRARRALTATVALVVAGGLVPQLTRRRRVAAGAMRPAASRHTEAGRRQAAAVRRRWSAPGHRRAARGQRRRARLRRSSSRTGRRPPATACSRRRRRTPARAGSRSPPARGRACTDRRTTRSTSTVSRSAIAPRAFDPRRAPSRDDCPVCRAGRQEGRPDRVGGWPQRCHRRPHARLPQLPLRAWRRHELHRPDGLADVHAIVRAAVRSSGRLRRERAVPRGGTVAGHRLERTFPTSFSPAMEMRLRVIDFGVDKYGLNAYIYDSRNDGRTRYDRVLFSPTKDGNDAVGDLREGEWADVKVTIDERARSTARPAASSSRSSGSPAICPRFACSTPP